MVNSEWPANFITNQLIATVLPDFNNKLRISQCLKIAKNVAFEFLCLGIFTNFCSIKIDLSGNTVWPQTSTFQKNRQTWLFFCIFSELLCSQNVNVARFARNAEWDFLWFSNTVFSTQFVDEQQKCYPQRLTRLGSQPITFSKLPGKFIISRITSLGSSSNRMKKFHILCTWPKFNIDEELGLNDSIIIQDRFHLLC